MKTNCQNCCFLKTDDDGLKYCAAEQYCVIPVQSDESPHTVRVETPGHCRLKRSLQWKAKEPPTLDDKSLIAIARHENNLQFDLIVIFDQWLHDIEDLQRTIASDWMNKRCKQIIISDIAGIDVSHGHSLEYRKSYDGDIPLQVDCSLNSESPVRAIRRMSQKCTSPYFLVLPAGKVLSDVKKLAHDIQWTDNRCVLWMFKQKYGGTVLSMRGNVIFSLYPRNIFRQLTGHCQEKCLDDKCDCKSFFNDVKQTEKDSEVFLAYFADGCILI